MLDSFHTPLLFSKWRREVTKVEVTPNESVWWCPASRQADKKCSQACDRWSGPQAYHSDIATEANLDTFKEDKPLEMHQKSFKAGGGVGWWHTTKTKPHPNNYFPQNTQSTHYSIMCSEKNKTQCLTTWGLNKPKWCRQEEEKHQKSFCHWSTCQDLLRENSNDKLTREGCGIQKTFDSHAQEQEFVKQGRLAALQLAGCRHLVILTYQVRKNATPDAAIWSAWMMEL